MSLLATTTVLILVVLGAQGSHFRGGTINWKTEGGTKVHFFFRLGWRYDTGPGCVPLLKGKLVTKMPDHFWGCQSNNCGIRELYGVNYYCTGADETENWEQGTNDFTYTFPNVGPFTIGFDGHAWISLSNGKGKGGWNIATTVDLRNRSDTGNPNSSPESQSKPIYYVPFNKEVRLQIPVIDPDNDRVRCRWAQGNECKSVCDALPYAYLDEETCTLEFNTTANNTYVQNGIYAVALTIEDFPRMPMTMGGNTTMSPKDVMSSVPLQFLVQTSNQEDSSKTKPRFVSPTPEEGEVITYEVGDRVKVGLYADNKNDTSAKADDIRASGPLAMTQSPVVPDVNRTNVYTTTLNWKTTPKDVGNHIVCGSVSNENAMIGTQRCFTLKVVPRGCKASPCQNDGKCVSNNYMCVCRPGFTGQDCEVDIDDCKFNTCPEGTSCVDGINAYTCANPTTTDPTPNCDCD